MDAISLLPREILGDILSLLPTKLAASTSVLSKKWRYVFALVDNLDFDDTVFLHPEVRKHQRPMIRECFRNFVSRTLSLQCDSHIKEFSLQCYIEDDSEMVSFVAPWIHNVLQRGVLNLYLSIKPRFEIFQLPDLPENPRTYGEAFLPYELLFTSKTLVKLTLGTQITLEKLPPDLSLPALKSLFLDSVHFHYNDLCYVLLPGCPVLEDLVVCHLQFKGLPFCISSRSIKKLLVDYDCEFGVSFLSHMSFDAPSLVSLDYSDYALPEYTKVNLPSLDEAKLDIRLSKKYGEIRPDLSGLIQGIDKVQTLHLSPDTVDVIYHCVEYGLLVPMFSNLVNLSFGSKTERGWNLLPYMLDRSPKLETLIIQGLDGYTGNGTMRPCLVKVLHVLGYGGTATELEHLKSILGELKCLELVQLEVAQGVVVYDAMILNTKRNLLGVVASSKCRIEVV